MQRRPVVLLPILLALGFMLFKFLTAERFTDPNTGKTRRVGMDPQQEQALGLQAYKEVLQQAGPNVVNSGAEVEQIKEVARRLASAASEKTETKYNWQISVVKSDQVNAFCLPGGEIVVFTGILPVAQNPAGLATVMGHEMAHATGRHAASRMFRQQLTQAALMGAQGGMSQMDPDQQRAVMGALGAGAQFGVSMPFSRDQESEADHVGLIFMARAGYDPHEALEFWKRMDQSAGGKAPPEYASDHPSGATRVQQIEGWLPEAVEEYNKSRMKDTKQPTQNTGM